MKTTMSPRDTGSGKQNGNHCVVQGLGNGREHEKYHKTFV